MHKINKIERIDSICKEKKQYNQLKTSQQQSQMQLQSKPKQQQQPQEQTKNKPKLISKSQFYEEYDKLQQPGKIQILSRNSNPKAVLNISTEVTSNLSYKNVVLNQSIQSKPTPSVPASTTELAPAASSLPIPFGLSNSEVNQSRNVLLNILTNSQQSKNSVSMVNTPQDDQKFVRLNKINKLRDVLRTNSFVPTNENFDLIEYFEHVCLINSIDLKYNQQQLSGEIYFGELFIESFRLVNETHKKRKSVNTMRIRMPLRF